MVRKLDGESLLNAKGEIDTTKWCYLCEMGITRQRWLRQRLEKKMKRALKALPDDPCAVAKMVKSEVFQMLEKEERHSWYVFLSHVSVCQYVKLAMQAQDRREKERQPANGQARRPPGDVHYEFTYSVTLA